MRPPPPSPPPNSYCHIFITNVCHIFDQQRSRDVQTWHTRHWTLSLSNDGTRNPLTTLSRPRSAPEIDSPSELPLRIIFLPMVLIPSSMRFLADKKLSVAWLAVRNDMRPLGRCTWRSLLLSRRSSPFSPRSSSWSDFVCRRHPAG